MVEEVARKRVRGGTDTAAREVKLSRDASTSGPGGRQTHAGMRGLSKRASTSEGKAESRISQVFQRRRGAGGLSNKRATEASKSAAAAESSKSAAPPVPVRRTTSETKIQRHYNQHNICIHRDTKGIRRLRPRPGSGGLKRPQPPATSSETNDHSSASSAASSATRRKFREGGKNVRATKRQVF